MNTPEITAPAVQAWLKQQLSDTGADVSAIRDFQLDIATSREESRAVMAFGYLGEGYSRTVAGYGTTVADAVREITSQVPTGAQLAAQKRADAAKLIAEADALEVGKSQPS